MIGHTIIELDKIASTNEHAENIIRDQYPNEGTVILAYDQYAGCGEGGTTWESEAGKNLTFSIILRPSFLRPEDQFYLSKMLALGVLKFLELYSDEVCIKWPNDLYVRDDKIAGILIENSFTGTTLIYSIAGIGVNLNQTSFPEDLPNPTALINTTGMEIDLMSALKLLCKIIDTHYLMLKEGRFQNIDSIYNGSLYRSHLFSDFESQGKRFKGKILGVEKTGELLIEKRNGDLKSFGFKEVVYL